MHISPFDYLPITLPFFSALAGVLAILWALLEIGVLGYAYTRLGLNPRAALLVLLLSLIGSFINIPVAELAEQRVASGQLIDYFGVYYVVPVVASWPGTIVAVNVGGAVIPVVVSVLLSLRYKLWLQGPLAIICVAAVSHLLAHPVHGLGIAVPIFVPALATAVTAILLSRRHAPSLAYIGGSCGTLVGADLLNMDKLQGLGAPVASIGGAGTFDGIFLTGILAVLIAGLIAAYGALHSGPGFGTLRQESNTVRPLSGSINGATSNMAGGRRPNTPTIWGPGGLRQTDDHADVPWTKQPDG